MEPRIMHRLTEVIFLFSKLGCIAFGGPAAHIAMMEEEVVQKRRWMEQQLFLDLVGATNLIPGPNSTEMALHCGYHRAGILGLWAAGICFIFPAALITLGFAWLYVEYGNVSQIAPLFIGIKPAVLAVIVSAIHRLGKNALKTWQLYCIAAMVVVISFFGINEVIAIFAGGITGALWLYITSQKRAAMNISPMFALWQSNKIFVPLAVQKIVVPVSASSIFTVFLKMGAVLFGSGYVLVAYLDAELVNRLGWLTRQQLLDAVAIGQFTPGPVLSTSTFIGYQLQGITGAVWATLGIFLPSFIFVWMLSPLIPKLRNSKWMSCFLDSVNASAVAIMLAVVCKMGFHIVSDWKTAVICGISMTLVFAVKKLGSAWIIAIGAASGYLLSFV